MSGDGREFGLDEAMRLRAGWHASGERLVLTNGCFDLLHVGHLRYLEAARALGDRLLVALNDDRSTRALKGPGRPIVPASERAELLCGFEVVDAVVLFASDTAVELVEALMPEIYVKGGDYDDAVNRPPEAVIAASLGLRVHYLPFVVGRSTSAIIERIRDGEAG